MEEGPERLQPAFTAGIYGAVSAAVPLVALSLPPAVFRSTPEHTHPLREWDAGGLAPHFFDHSGNFVDGVLLAGSVIGIGSWLDEHISGDHQRQLIIGTAAAGMLFSSGINVAYEASTSHPATATTPEDPFDTADALYGSVAGAIVSLAFCAAALWQRAKLGRQNT